jgi:hypothetical protein
MVILESLKSSGLVLYVEVTQDFIFIRGIGIRKDSMSATRRDGGALGQIHEFAQQHRHILSFS